MEDSKQQNEIALKKEKDLVPVDRVIVGRKEAAILSKWITEVNAKSDGLVKISKSDLLNYLIAAHSPMLSNEEVRGVANRYYDETRWLSWSVNKMKEAKRKGEVLIFDNLIKFRDEHLGKPVATSQKRQTKKDSGLSLEDN